MSNKNFYDCFGKSYTLEEVVDEIVAFMQLDTSRSYNIIIGTDSENHNDADFVSAIIVHRVGNGGRYWWRRLKLSPFKSLRMRIWKEVSLSLELAQSFLNEVYKRSNFPEFQIEIHVDVGVNGNTHQILQEVVGAIRGSGFMVRTKPESYGASKVADRHICHS
jgi:predicted RNase H-related nuclease YkuK (DUF458 family)